MHLLCVGISHRTAAVELREKLAFDAAACRDALGQWGRRFDRAGFVLLSTCNRTELYTARPLHSEPARQAVVEMLAEAGRIDPAQLAAAAYHHVNRDMIEHLFRVCCSLDSMVLGETQIVSQVKQAYDLATQSRRCNRPLHIVFQTALAVSKRARTDTLISQGRVSVSSVAVDFARHLFDDLHRKTVVCLGAGKMGRLTLDRFMDHEPGRVIVASRSATTTQPLARQYNAETATLDALESLLIEADIVIACTAATEPLIDKPAFSRIMRQRRHRPLFIVDIALPRDFDSSLGDLENVYLYNLDDLERVIEANQQDRAEQQAACDAIIRPAAEQCYEQIQTGDLAELVKAVRRDLHEMGDAEARRLAGRLAGASPQKHQDLIEQHMQRLVNRILHHPLSQLNRTDPGEAARVATALRRVFDIRQGLQPTQPGDVPIDQNPGLTPDEATPAQSPTNRNRS
jgi:glutamyl-tRNA reductase